MSDSVRPKTRYKTTNWATYNASLKARGSLTIWLDRDMQWFAAPSGKRGRQRTFSDAAIQFCLSIKCLFGLALRQSLGLVESLLRLAGLDWPVPNFSTVSRRQQNLAVIPPRKNAKLWKVKHAGDLARNEAVRACQRLGRRLWKNWSGYHRRSLVETKMHCFKRLGERVMARTFARQVTELHIRVALLNRFTQLGCPTTVPVVTVA